MQVPELIMLNSVLIITHPLVIYELSGGNYAASIGNNAL
jgi:hypothetical protein